MKKKILFVIWSFSLGGGAEKMLSVLTRNLDIDKYEIDILEIENHGYKEKRTEFVEARGGPKIGLWLQS